MKQPRTFELVLCLIKAVYWILKYGRKGAHQRADEMLVKLKKELKNANPT